jgi:hypothetical protein
MMQVNVQMLSGPLPPIDVPVDATVRDLKHRVQSIDSNFEVHLQKLLIRDLQYDELLNGRTLESYDISSDTIIMLVIAEQLFKHVSQFKYTILCATINLKRFDTECISQISVRTDQFGYGAESLSYLVSKYLSVRLFEIDGYWLEEHLLFCQELLKLRADIDIRYVFRRFNSLVIKILEFCKTARNPKLEFADCILYAETDYVSLSKALQSISSLNELALNNNRIAESGLIALAPALMSMSSLQSLRITGNCLLGNAGCTSLAAVLPSMSALISVDLSSNQLSGTECAMLVSALSMVPTLQSLSLWHNHIGAAGCEVLAPALRSMTSLRVLELPDNQITEKGFTDLESALVFLSHASLDRLDLRGNRLDAARCKRVLHAIPHLAV